MGLFSFKGNVHLKGFKELSKDEEILSIMEGENAPKVVFFPSLFNKREVVFNVNVNDYVKVGTKIGVLKDFDLPIYSSVSGVVSDIKDIYSSQSKNNIKTLLISNDFKYERDTLLKTVNLDSSKEEIKEAIKNSGLVGLGGAGFPTYIKYNATNIDTLLINCIECEPFLTSDYKAILNDIDYLLKGIPLLLKALDAKKAIIAFKKKNTSIKEIILSHNTNENITIYEAKDLYPMGYERTLIRRIFNKEYDKLPSEIGIVVNNVQTVIELSKTLLTGKTLNSRIVTVSGDAIGHPCNILCPIGTMAKDLINVCHGYTKENVNLIVGGPMCSSAINTDEFPLLIANNSLTILEYNEYLEEPCLRCGRCSSFCTMSLQPVEIVNAAKRQDIDRLATLDVMACVECGICSYVCPSRINVLEGVKKGKILYRLKGRKVAKWHIKLIHHLI